MLRLRALVLLAEVCVSALAAQASPLVYPLHAQPAGCHGHGHKTPAREPTNYRCCMAGHDAVTLPPSFLIQPYVHAERAVPLAELATETTFVRGIDDLLASSGDPPCNNPLRI